ncbi:MAG: hypothetical protein ACW98A_06530, partial [Candidatus Hodarchaeales archaeon]
AFVALFAGPGQGYASDIMNWLWFIVALLFILILLLAGIDGLVPDVIPEDVTKYLLWIGVLVWAVFALIGGLGNSPLDITF